MTKKKSQQGSTKLEFKNRKQKEFAKQIDNHNVTVCKGPAGTGKTFVACSKAIKDLQNPETPQTHIYLVKSVRVTDGEDIGFLRGSEMEKFEPHIWSFILALEKIIGRSNVNSMRDEGDIRILPVAFATGISIDNAYVLIDEAQNLTPEALRRVLTRLGENTKAVVMGDERQSDFNQSSGLSFMMDHSDAFEQEGVAFTSFDEGHIVRSESVRSLESVFAKILDT